MTDASDEPFAESADTKEARARLRVALMWAVGSGNAKAVEDAVITLIDSRLADAVEAMADRIGSQPA